jgi:arylsulfatase A-like enzyme
MPTRAMLSTGRYGYQTGSLHNALTLPKEWPLRQWIKGNRTFAQVLHDHGYATAMSGKRHEMGGGGSETDAFFHSKEVGFDEYCMYQSGGKRPDGFAYTGAWESETVLPGYAGRVASRYWHPSIICNGTALETKPDDFSEDIFTDFVIEFIRHNKARPFAVYYPMLLPHGGAGGDLPVTPLSGPPGRNKGGTLKECTEYIDVLVGRLLAALEEEGLLNNTLVVFAGDNADAGGGKTHATEQGVRVPLVVGGPSWVKHRPPTAELCSLVDIFPTLVDLAGARLPDGYQVDGVSLAPFLKGESNVTRDYVYSYIGTARMIRDSRWLLEAVDPMGGHPDGRFYFCGDEVDPAQYREITGPMTAEEEKARDHLRVIMESIPFIDTTDPETQELVKRYLNSPYPHRLTPHIQ